MTDIIRSFLFVPADSEKKLAKAEGLAADALILDLEDAVLSHRKKIAREMCVDFLKTARPSAQIWVRINPLDSGQAHNDLHAILPHTPAGIMLPKPDGPVDIESLSRMIDGLENTLGKKNNHLKILPVATETARAVLSLGLYPRTHLPKLFGLTWGAEDLATDLGATTNKDDKGYFRFTYQMVRSQTLIAAKAAGVQAIETLYDNFRDKEGLRQRAQRAYADGFSGMLAIHPAQIDMINTCFSPSEAQVRHARAVIQAFRDDPDAGAVSVGGKMTDIPHLKQAENIVSAYEGFDKK